LRGHAIGRVSRTGLTRNAPSRAVAQARRGAPRRLRGLWAVPGSDRREGLFDGRDGELADEQ
jgi:hypothetical protein